MGLEASIAYFEVAPRHPKFIRLALRRIIARRKVETQLLIPISIFARESDGSIAHGSQI